MPARRRTDHGKERQDVRSARGREHRGSPRQLEVYGSKQTAYIEALRARDALLPDLVKSQRSLKTQAAAAWEGDPGTLEAVFAPPARLVAPKKKRAAKPPPKDGG